MRHSLPSAAPDVHGADVTRPTLDNDVRLKKTSVLIFGDNGILCDALKAADTKYLKNVRSEGVTDEYYGYQSPTTRVIDCWRGVNQLAVIAVDDGVVSAARLLTSLERPADCLVVCTPKLPREFREDMLLGYVAYSGPALLIVNNALEQTGSQDDFVISQCLQFQAQANNIIIGSDDPNDHRPILQRPNALAKVTKLVFETIRRISDK